MQIAKTFSVCIVLSFSHLIISCGQNVQNPEYSRNSGSNSNNTRPGSANNIGQKTANIDNNRGNAVTTSTSIVFYRTATGGTAAA